MINRTINAFVPVHFIFFLITVLAPFYYLSESSSRTLNIFSTDITQVVTEGNLNKARFDIGEGNLVMYLPSDMAVNERVSGSIEFEFKDLDESYNVSLSVEDYSLVIENRDVSLRERNFTFQVPYNLPAGVLNVSLKGTDGKDLGRAYFPVRLTAHNQYEHEREDTATYRIPPAARQGHPVIISGPFDGSYRTTRILVSGKEAEIIAQSPRTLVFKTPEGISGSANIVLVERDIQIARTFTVLTIVRVGEAVQKDVSPVQMPHLYRHARIGEFISAAVDPSRDSVQEKAVLPGIRNEKDHNGYESVVESMNDQQRFEEEEYVQISKEHYPEPKAKSVDSPIQSRGYGEYAGSAEDINRISHILEEQYYARVSVSHPDQESEPDIQSHMAPVDMNVKTADQIKIAESTAPSTPKYAIQLASVKENDKAAEIVEKLRIRGYNAYSVKADIPEKGVWYRIRIGGFETRDQAFEYKSSLTLDDLFLHSVNFFVTEE